MTHQYTITGMTCQGCRDKVESLLKKVDHITEVNIDLEKSMAELTMDNHVSTADLQKALADYPKYELSELKPQHSELVEEEKTSTWQTYKPVFLIGIYLMLVTLLIQFSRGGFVIDSWMSHFMGGFFLVFSFFKMFDLAGFADSYSMYDIIAKRWKAWGYIYPFVELGLGLLFISGFIPLAANIITLVVMTLSFIGVLQSVMNKRKIRCACLGAVFNLPMSTVTIIEDGMMIAMSGVMLLI